MPKTKKDAWNPEQYHRFQKERSAPFFDLVSLIKKTSIEKAIDLGCGTGELTQSLHQTLKIKETIGLDHSPAMLEKTKSFTDSGLSFEQGDLSTFTANSQYDLIFSNAALHWCPDHPRLFAGLFQALKPGGQLAVQMPANHDYPTHVEAKKLAAENPFRLAQSAKENSVLTIEEYSSLLYRIGFKDQSVRMQVYGHVLESREEVLEWIKGSTLTAYESKLSPELFQDFVSELKNRLFQILPDEKPFFYPFKRILLWASR